MKLKLDIKFRRYKRIEPETVEATKMDKDFAMDLDEGYVRGFAGDYIVRYCDGRVKSFSKEIFEGLYEKVDKLQP